MTFQTAALLLTWLALLALTLACAGLLRMVQELQRRDGGSGALATTPSVVGLALPATGTGSLLRPEGGGLVLFVAPGCAACAEVLEEIAATREPGSSPSLVLAALGPCPPQGLTDRCIPDAHALADLVHVPATPFVLAVDADGTVRDTHLPTGPGSLSRWFADQEATSR